MNNTPAFNFARFTESFAALLAEVEEAKIQKLVIRYPRMSQFFLTNPFLS